MNKLKISVKQTDGYKLLCNGRLIGYITDNETQAIINTPKAANKIFTSETIAVNDTLDEYALMGKRFVIATCNYLESKSRQVFISPKIFFVNRNFEKHTYHCWGGKQYILENCGGEVFNV